MDLIPPHATVLLLEYEQLKEEQRQRIGTRDNLVYATFGVVSMVVAGALQSQEVALLALLPPACVVLGWTHLVNDDRVTAIGIHIQSSLAPELAILLGISGSPLFGWERSHRADPLRRVRKFWQFLADVLIFCLPGVVALIMLSSSDAFGSFWVAIALVEAVAIAALVLRMIGHARAGLALSGTG